MAPLTPSNVTPADKNIPAEDITPDQNGAKSVAAVYIKAPVSPHPTEHTESKPQEPGPDTPAPETAGESIPQRSVPDSVNQLAQVMFYCYQSRVLQTDLFV